MRKRAAADLNSGNAPHQQQQQQQLKAPRLGVSAAESDVLGGTYVPKTKETARAYEQLLRDVAALVGDVPHEMLTGFADELLYRLKSDQVAPRDKRRAVEKEVFQRAVSDEQFAALAASANAISDFADEIDAAARAAAAGAGLRGDARDDTAAAAAAADANNDGISLVFADDDDADDDDDDKRVGTYELRSDSDDSDDDDDGAKARSGGPLVATSDAGDMAVDVDDGEIDPTTIDAHWLQRQVSKNVTDDAQEAQELSVKIFAALESASDARVAENELLTLLQYSHFDLVKLLCINRKAIVYCTRLLRAAGNADARAAVEDEMRNDAQLVRVLERLQHTRVAGDRVAPRGALGAMAAEAKTAKQQQQKHDQQQQQEQEQHAAAEQKPLKALDIEAMAFSQGGHLMSNKQCIMPPDAVSVPGKGFTTIHIPARIAPKQPDERLVPVDALPEWARDGFAGMQSFNRIQSKVYEAAFKGVDNMLICSPTGSGKTNIAMLAIMHELAMHRDDAGVLQLADFKIVYVAPMKALVQEVVQNLSNRLQAYGVVVRELSGDQNLTKAQIDETQIIVTTPEKWDIVTRKAGERTYTQLVRLLIIDEIHLLHDDRGPVLESLVARTIRQIEASQQMVRIVGLSATLPNYDDVATFLRVVPSNVFYFDNSYRPVPLQQTFIGITEKKGMKRFNLMNQICFEKVMEHAIAGYVPPSGAAAAAAAGRARRRSAVPPTAKRARRCSCSCTRARRRRRRRAC
jgi:pre-mRNA-splicing helicase BRR2